MEVEIEGSDDTDGNRGDGWQAARRINGTEALQRPVAEAAISVGILCRLVRNRDLEHAQSSGLAARSPAVALDRVQTGWGRILSEATEVWKRDVIQPHKAASVAAKNLFNVGQRR